MPILVNASTPAPPPPPHIILPTPVVSDAYSMTWIVPDADTTVVPLMTPSLGWHLLDALVGVHGAVPISVTTDDVQGGGVNVRNEIPQARIMTLPVRIDGPGPADYLTRYRQLARWFTMTRRRGAGTLLLARPDGSVRQIKARYYAGFDPAPGDLSGWLYGDIALQLLCPDPYWSDTIPIPIERVFEASPADFQDPYFTLSSSQTLGDAVINNPGDAEAYPVWTITGPATLITATLTTTLPPSDDGEPGDVVTRTWTIDPNATGIAHGNLVGGEIVTVSTKPQKVRGPDGSVWTAALGFPDNANLWALEPGDNTVSLAITGAAAGTSIVGSFLPRWETP